MSYFPAFDANKVLRITHSGESSSALEVRGGTFHVFGDNSCACITSSGALMTYGLGEPGDADYERIRLVWDGSTSYVLQTQAAGTGTVRPIYLKGSSLTADGVFKIVQYGGVAGTDEVQIYHDGSDTNIRSMSGRIVMRAGSEGTQGIRLIKSDFPSQYVDIIVTSGNGLTFQMPNGGLIIGDGGALINQQGGKYRLSYTYNSALALSTSDVISWNATDSDVSLAGSDTRLTRTSGGGLTVTSTVTSADLLTLQAPASFTGNYLNLKTSAGTSRLSISDDGSITSISAAGVAKLAALGSYVELSGGTGVVFAAEGIARCKLFGGATPYFCSAANIQHTWSNTSDNPTATADLGIVRSASGVLKVTDGTTGLGSLICGSYNSETIGLTVKATGTGAATVNNKALTSNVATLTTSAAHGFSVGSSVVVAGVDSTFNGTYTITTVPTTTTFTYAKTASNVSSTSASGTATVSQNASIQEWQDGSGNVFMRLTGSPKLELFPPTSTDVNGIFAVNHYNGNQAFRVDTSGYTVKIGCDSGGSGGIWISGSPSNISVPTGTDIRAHNYADYTITSPTVTCPSNSRVPLIVKGVASQSANFTEWQNSSGTALTYISGTDGGLTVLSTGGTGSGSSFGGTDKRGVLTVQKVGFGTFSADTDPQDGGRAFVMQDYTTSNNANDFTNVTLQINPTGSLSGGRCLADMRLIRETTNQSNCYFLWSGFKQAATYTDWFAIGNNYAWSRGSLNIGTNAAASGVQLGVICGSASTKGLIVKAASSQTANLQEWQDNSGTALASIAKNGAFVPASLADADAANGTIYYSTDASKLVYKDSGGTVNNLY